MMQSGINLGSQRRRKDREAFGQQNRTKNILQDEYDITTATMWQWSRGAYIYTILLLWQTLTIYFGRSYIDFFVGHKLEENLNSTLTPPTPPHIFYRYFHSFLKKHTLPLMHVVATLFVSIFSASFTALWTIYLIKQTEEYILG